MPRQNFLSSDFFVSATEAEAREALISIPDHLPHIKLLKENSLIQSIRFLYEHPEKSIHNYMDVTILPLDDQYIRFSLHASYTNGQAFYADPDISHALSKFEKAVHAAINKDFSTFRDEGKSAPKRTGFILTMLLSIFGLVYLWKKI
jgi:hypothetical protein